MSEKTVSEERLAYLLELERKAMKDKDKRAVYMKKRNKWRQLMIEKAESAGLKINKEELEKALKTK